MAKPLKDGLDYFPFDVPFFSDKKIKRLRAKYGNDGVMVYIYLLCEIYRNGYYIDYDDDLILDISDDLNISENATKQIMNYLLSRSLFDDTLAKSVKVLTAKSVQLRYQEAVRERAKKRASKYITVDAKFWVLKKEETEGFIKVRLNDETTDKNNDFPKNNSVIPENCTTKESKENKSKVKESKGEDSPDKPAQPSPINKVFDLFNQICISYPKVTAYSEARKKAVKARLNSGYTIDDFKTLFKKSEESDFLKGKNNRNWTANFDWLIKDSNMAKVLDGNYDNKSDKKSGNFYKEDNPSFALDDYAGFVNVFPEDSQKEDI